MPTLDGIHFTDSGAGTAPLVLVHGFTCDHTDWQAQIGPLSEKYRVIALDLPGHGQSQQGEPTITGHGAAVATLVHQLELDNVTLIGHSMGCRVILEAMANCRERSAGLVFVDGSRIATGPSEYEAAKARIDAIAFADFSGALFGQMFTNKTAAEIRERVIARCLAMDPTWAGALFTNMAHWDAHRFHTVLATNELPMLVLQTTTIANAGNRESLDAGAATEFIDYLKSMFVNSCSYVEVLPDTGHFPQFEEPDQLNAAIRRFMELQS